MPKLDFKVTGRVDGQHRIETSESHVLHLSDRELEKYEAQHNRLSTNDFDSKHRSSPAEPGISSGDAGAWQTAYNALRAEFLTLTSGCRALEERIVILENAIDIDKIEEQGDGSKAGKPK